MYAQSPDTRLAGSPSIGVLGANDRIKVGIIGVGFAIGANHLLGIQQSAKENNAIIGAACDVFEMRRDWARKSAGLEEADVYIDYRRLLERKDIDAVLVATHDPLHAQISIDALSAGKHVFCERPLSRHLGEAFQVFDKVKSSGKIFQLGVQSCSAGAWHKCAELVKAGRIGTLVWGQADYCRNGGPSCDGCYKPTKEATAATVDWEKWLGPLKKRPFNALHFCQWRIYEDYSAGLLATTATQRIYPLMLATGKPEFPKRVMCVSSRHPLENSFYPRSTSKRVPAHLQFTAEFPGGYLLTSTCSWLNSKNIAPALYGHKATLTVRSSGDQVELLPEKEFSTELNSESFTKLNAEDVRAHEKNWFDCIRSASPPNADIELALRGQVVLSLAEISHRSGTTCLFDQTTRKVTDASGREIIPPTYESL
jgi:predicted dehydrogenase